MSFHKLALKHCTPESSNGCSEHTCAALQCYEVTEGWKNNCQLKQTSMNLQNEKLDVSANSIEPKGKYTKKKKCKKAQPKRTEAAMHILCVLRNQSTDKRKENSTIWKVRTVITLYVVKQLLTPISFL